LAPEKPKAGSASEDTQGALAFEDSLKKFFASEEEVEAVQGISLEFYRDEQERRLLAEENVREYLSFNLSHEVFGIPIENIKEIIKPPYITQLPRTEPVIVGIISLRGVIVPVIDIGRRLGMEAVKFGRKTRILILEQQQEQMGCLVDSVRSVVRLREEQVEPAPQVFDRAQAEHIIGVGRVEGEVVTLLSVKCLFEIAQYIRTRRRANQQ
jgi:purine-binding chemotaxis protein CheW